MRYFLRLAYNGKRFHGWQSQPNAVSVQSQIEEVISTLLRQHIGITGAGRTDSGVHAREMFAHFDSDVYFDHEKFLMSLNRMIGKDIVVSGLAKVPEEAHARFDASLRTYKYLISYNKNPFLKDYFWLSPSILDIKKMNEAASVLLSTEDFTSFAKLHSDVKTNICKVSHACWEEVSKDRDTTKFIGELNNGLVFTISADRFLRNMVRAIVGTLVDVGRGKLSLDGFVDIIRKKDRNKAGTSMPAEGLFLWEVKYPFELEYLSEYPKKSSKLIPE